MREILRLSGENFECFPLGWDTDYFGVRSGRVILRGVIAPEDQDKIIDYCKHFEFVTISNIGNIKENNCWIGKRTDAFLTDINIQFAKSVDKKPDFIDDSTKTHSSYSRDERVIQIAQSAFQCSRFFNDPALPEKQALNIYLHWTKCAFERSDKYFVIAKRNDEVAGYILFSVDQLTHIATIELIAVDEKFRGQRVGKSLISEMQLFAYDNGIHNIKVGTQVDNVGAAQFYIACGFQYVSCSSVYHMWFDI
jgi:ribosomal protein S18 acetylase RimI-like enzyme